MDHLLPPSWTTIVFLLNFLLSTSDGYISCSDVKANNCVCINANSIEITCPRQDFERTSHEKYRFEISRSGEEIQLQCADNVPDLNIIPEANLSDVQHLKVQFCPIKGTIDGVIKNFNVSYLEIFTFEGMPTYTGSLSNETSYKPFFGLKSLKVSFSKLEKDFLSNTPNLKELTLKRNWLAELENYFVHLPNLEILSVTENNVTKIPDKVFLNLTKLRKLFLFNNNINSLSRLSFAGLESVDLLELSGNNIEKLPEDAFASLTKLKTISLRGNGIQRAPAKLFLNNLLLETIRLDQNPGIILEEYLFLNCNKVTELVLSYNNLSELPKKVFRSLTRLRSLSIAFNQITFLSVELFSMTGKLETLDLSHNQLTQIPRDLFAKLNDLQELYLQNNNIQTIDFGAFSALNKVKVFNFSFNKWKCNSTSDPFGELFNVKRLLLNNNQIDTIPELYSLVFLNELDLSFNHIEELEVNDILQFIPFLFFCFV